MIAVSEAQHIILQHAWPLPPVTAPLTSAALGQVLAEDVASDLDMPPHDKSLVDGYAVRCADLPEGRGVLRVVEEITAGQAPSRPVGPGEAARIMTGAPLPAGADAVIMIEHTEWLDGRRVRVADRPPGPGQHTLARGREMRRGEVVLTAGCVLRPAEFALLATVGRVAARVYPAARVAVAATGDELVEPTQAPGPGQIRNGDGPLLCAQVSRAGGLPRYLGIARDSEDSLRERIGQGRDADVLLLSGGVSTGDHDLTPGVLRALGVTAHFHRVAMKPGRPMFFGTWPRPAGVGPDAISRPPILVFGLPGNPVSAFVCFELFVRPALRRLGGQPRPLPQPWRVPLAEDYTSRGDRPTYHPAVLEPTDAGVRARVVPWFGSADLRALTRANALLFLPAGDRRHEAGDLVSVFPTD